jgi:hypothetical protein
MLSLRQETTGATAVKAIYYSDEVLVMTPSTSLPEASFA